mgnify:CR=1 FL=1
MVRAQGGDPDAALPQARESHVVHAVRDGIVTRLDAYGVGVAAWRLGAGRARKEDPVQAGAGVRWHVLQGERVRPGQALATLYTDTPERFPAAMADLAGAITVGDPADLARVAIGHLDRTVQTRPRSGRTMARRYRTIGPAPGIGTLIFP